MTEHIRELTEYQILIFGIQPNIELFGEYIWSNRILNYSVATLNIYIIKTQLLCVCLFVRIVLKRWRNKNSTYNWDRDKFPKLIIGEQVRWFRISHLKISNMNIYCCCLHKVNKLVETKNEPRDLLTNVNKGKQVCWFRISHLKISHMNICCRCLHKENKLVEIKNEPRDLLTNVNKGRQVCWFRISNLKISHMDICCCLPKVHKSV